MKQTSEPSDGIADGGSPLGGDVPLPPATARKPRAKRPPAPPADEVPTAEPAQVAAPKRAAGPGARRRAENAARRPARRAADAAGTPGSGEPDSPSLSDESGATATEPPAPDATKGTEVAGAGVPTDVVEVLSEVRELLVDARRLADARATSELAVAAVVQQQQAMIVRIDQAARRAQNIDVLRHLVGQFLRESRVRAVGTIESPEQFPGASADGTWEVVEPAYVDIQTGRLIQPGRAVPMTTEGDAEEEDLA